MKKSSHFPFKTDTFFKNFAYNLRKNAKPA